MPSSIIIMAVAYAASEAAAAYALGTLATMALIGAATATASTAMNGGSWGDAFVKGFVGAGIGEATGAIGSGVSDASQAAGPGMDAGATGAFDSDVGGSIPGLTNAGTDATSSGLGASMEGAGAGTSDLGGGLSGMGQAPTTGAFDSGTGGSAYGGSQTSSSSGGLSSGVSSDSMDTGMGSSASSDIGNSLSTPASTYTGSDSSSGGLEGFQNSGSTDYGQYAQGQQSAPGVMGSGTYDSTPSQPNFSAGSNGSAVGGYSNLGTSGYPTQPGVSDFQGMVQKGANGLEDFWNSKGPSTAIRGLGALYDTYSRNQMAKGYQQNMQQLGNMYAPGSPEYNLLQQKLDRQNAASGRRSQSLTNATNFANQVQAQRNQALGSAAYNQNLNNYNNNQYGNLNSLFRFGSSLFQ